jgi:hypothetical protein
MGRRMAETPHERREHQRKRDERRLEKLLAILNCPSAAVLPDVEVWKALTIKHLEAVRDPEAYRAWHQACSPPVVHRRVEDGAGMSTLLRALCLFGRMLSVRLNDILRYIGVLQNLVQQLRLLKQR